ncbi:hypothetical protein C8J57DRAFT_1231228 [Mycena rebaudengoi]|nr:hypothetical protein C8J57DRAFT_1231228 [Mycena rebaudengoi]
MNLREEDHLCRGGREDLRSATRSGTKTRHPNAQSDAEHATKKNPMQEHANSARYAPRHAPTLRKAHHQLRPQKKNAQKKEHIERKKEGHAPENAKPPHPCAFTPASARAPPSTAPPPPPTTRVCYPTWRGLEREAEAEAVHRAVSASVVAEEVAQDEVDTAVGASSPVSSTLSWLCVLSSVERRPEKTVRLAVGTRAVVEGWRMGDAARVTRGVALARRRWGSRRQARGRVSGKGGRDRNLVPCVKSLRGCSASSGSAASPSWSLRLSEEGEVSGEACGWGRHDILPCVYGGEWWWLAARSKALMRRHVGKLLQSRKEHTGSRAILQIK